ncbi:MAG TPA: hypothetical protein VNI34_03645 [Candidatus Nitrosotalea sp.]|nr:hypothetical protein [Candidatus Nitrosotalea sp.]
MEELRLAEINAVADLGPSFVEVRGQIVIRHARRLSDYLNHPDPMLELDGGAIRQESDDFWEEVQGLSLNRNRVLIVSPTADADPGPDPKLVVSSRQVRIKILCRGVSVVGFVTVPMQATISSFIHETRARFLNVSQARLFPTHSSFRTQLGPALDFCMVNREYIVACVETRPGIGAAGEQ